MIAPIPRAVSDHGPSDLGRRCPGLSESEISLSMDFLAKSWLARKASLRTRDASNGPRKQQCGAEAHNGASTPASMLSAWMCREPSSSSWAFWSRAHIRGASWAPAFCAPCAWISCVLPCSVLSYLPCTCPSLKDVLRISLCALQVRVFFHQLFQSESWKLYRNLGVFSFTFTPVHHSLAIFGVFHALSGTKRRATCRLLHRNLRPVELFAP